MMITWICIDELHKPSCPSNTKIDLSDHTFIKDNIFEATVTFPPRGTPIGILDQYCKYHTMSYDY